MSSASSFSPPPSLLLLLAPWPLSLLSCGAPLPGDRSLQGEPHLPIQRRCPDEGMPEWALEMALGPWPLRTLVAASRGFQGSLNTFTGRSPFWLKRNLESLESQGGRESCRGMLLFALGAWSLLCVILGMCAGCWCTRRCARKSSMTEGGSPPGPPGHRAEDDDDEAEADSETEAAASAAKRLKSEKARTIRKMPQCCMYHTDAPHTMLHSRPDCTGLRLRSNKVVSRRMCSLCCGHNDLIIAR